MRKSASARSRQDETGIGESARWIVMLPLAAVFAAVAYGASAIGLTMLGYALFGPATNAVPTVAAVASTVASAAMAYVLVWTAVVIAPSRRARVAQALIGVGTAVAAITMYDAAFALDTTGALAGHGPLASGAGFFIGMLAAGFRLHRIRD